MKKLSLVLSLILGFFLISCGSSSNLSVSNQPVFLAQAQSRTRCDYFENTYRFGAHFHNSPLSIGQNFD
ncbi:MAG: hypothetical protein NW237_15665 [Cyanobacteriota bacterium]|nr:hypothetical protein [Cyanobacteriota bacterium]